jgi:hypothetical protein
MWKEGVMIYFLEQLEHLSVGTQEYDKEPETAGVAVELRTSHLPNTSPKHCRLSHFPRKHGYLFIYKLFKNSISNSGYIAHITGWLESMWHEVVTV